MKKAKNNIHYSRPILHVYGYPAPTTNEIIIFVCFLLLLPANPNYAAAQFFNDTSIQNPQNPFGNNSSFKPSMGVTIAVLIGAFIFMGFFSIYIRQCSQTQSDGSVRQTFGRGRSRRAVRGLDPAVIETFPTFIYSVVKGLKIGKGTLECAVCLNEFEDDETLRLLPKCDHVFHPECIDAWLSSHTTCPVCRANLVPVPGEETSIIAIAQPPDSDIRSQNEIVSSEINDLQHQVSVRVIEDQNKDSQVPDVINPTQIPIQNRPVRSRSTRPRIFGRFPRSHSTGHSLVQPGENCERFTLKLPEEVRKKIVEGKLNRTTSCVTLSTGQGSVSRWSSRRGYRSGGEGSSRGKNYQFERLDGGAAKSDHWMFSMAPPFFWRTSSVRSQKKTEGSVNSPFDCIGAKPDDGEPSSSARPPV